MVSILNLRLKRTLLLSAVAIGVASPALAQTAPAAGPPADSPTVLTEVIVTTQRRSERLKDVPISVSAATGAQLENAGVSNIKELSFFVPGVKIDQTSNYVQPAIRGVSSSVTGPSTDAPVAVYVDGVIQPNQVANHFDFADIDRMEVAKGPQGTLFGRNATGGAVSVFTKAPSFTPSGNVTVGYGNYSNVLAKGYVTGPIIGDVLAGSLSLFYNQHDGYSYDIARHIDTKGLDSKLVRGKLLYKPAPWAAFTLTASWQDRYDSDTADGIALGRSTVANLDPNAIIATQPHTISFDTNSYLDLHQAAGILRSEFDLGLGKLTMINSATKVWANVAYDADRASSTLVTAAYIYPQPDDTYTNEITFASRKFYNRYSFVVGLYDYYDNNRFAPNNVFSGHTAAPGFSFNSWNPARARAVFGEVNVDLTDRLLLIAGLRYSTESRSNKGNAAFGAEATTSSFVQGPHVTFSATTPRVSLRYKIDESTNVYATYSEGFKSGGIQSTAFLVPSAFWAATQIYQPETIKAIEVGVKSSLTPTLSFNLAAYHYNYNNLQVQVQSALGGGTIQNAATAIIDGLDGDVRWRPADGLTLTGGVSLLNARYDQFKNALVLVPVTKAAGTPCLPGTLPTTIPQGNAACLIDASGNTLPRAPKATLTLGVDYKKDIGAGDIDINAEAFYTTRVYFDSNERVNQPAYALFNAQASFQPHGSPVKISVWGKNLTNKDYISSTFLQNTADVVGYGTPRTYGIELNYTF